MKIRPLKVKGLYKIQIMRTLQSQYKPFSKFPWVVRVICRIPSWPRSYGPCWGSWAAWGVCLLGGRRQAQNTVPWELWETSDWTALGETLPVQIWQHQHKEFITAYIPRGTHFVEAEKVRRKSYTYRSYHMQRNSDNRAGNVSRGAETAKKIVPKVPGPGFFVCFLPVSMPELSWDQLSWAQVYRFRFFCFCVSWAHREQAHEMTGDREQTGKVSHVPWARLSCVIMAPT